MKEIWKDIDNYEGLYQVSSMGNIRSFKRNIEVILKNSKDDAGYNSVSLHCRNKKVKTIRIHRLVAKTFIKNPHTGHGHPISWTRFVSNHLVDNEGSISTALSKQVLASSSLPSS